MGRRMANLREDVVISYWVNFAVPRQPHKLGVPRLEVHL
jgi:hypothetical protein